MDDLSDFTSEIIEFPATENTEKRDKKDIGIGTDPLPSTIDATTETASKSNAETQTKNYLQNIGHVEDKKLYEFLCKIYQLIEEQLLEGITPILDEQLEPDDNQDLEIETYQKIVPNCGEASIGLATWLSVHTNDAPVLVLTTSCARFTWCEHINQSLKVYTPKRLQSGDFVYFNEVKSIPLRCCLSRLTTNPFNKNMFAGGTYSGDIIIWLYDTSTLTIEVNELYNVIAPRDSVVAVEWLSENHLLTCHNNAYIQEWILGNTLRKANQYKIAMPRNRSHDITTIAVIGLQRIVVGTRDGGVYHCRFGVNYRHVELHELKRHPFTVSSMSSAKMNGCEVVISSDISGQVYFHDLNKINERTDSSLKLPMAFRNVIACKNDASVIFAPGVDGSLECYRIDNNQHMTIKGALRGIGSFVKLSDNKNWIITGLYEGAFQIFHMNTIDSPKRSFFEI